MLQAVEIAWRHQFLTYPNPAVGAAIVKDGKVLALEAHYQAGMPHAEVNACKSAFQSISFSKELESLESSHDIHDFLIQNHNGIFYNCEIYVTLEPCNHVGSTPACANLLKELRFKKVYIGSLDPNNKASGGITTLQKAGIEVESGVEKEACNNLLYPFKKWLNGDFQFFKIAMREDGSIDGGYITSQDSLNLVHEIRTKLDLLIIGGETVRIDRPTLDARFAKVNKAPNILIYSDKKELDNSIPLFQVDNRDVYIDNRLDRYKYEFMMIEGGYRLLDHFKNKIDILMVFISHKEKSGKKYSIEDLGFRKIYSYYINDTDEVLFYKVAN
jgi:diaminohydroxyphosphoribosylaminopyrimidine deaminase / 5-amino-6-(5-phosphoribosylamino)uracil reductase